MCARGERLSGSTDRLDEFYDLWNDYWAQKIVPHPHAHRRLRRWRFIMALFEQTWQIHELAIKEAQLRKGF